MPTKEIKELRQSGKLDEAYAMAKAELEAEPDNIWAKRNMSWVLYSQLDKASGILTAFITKLNELKELALPESEEMLFDNLSIVIAKAARHISSQQNINLEELSTLFTEIKDLPLKKPSKWYSSLFSAFHKGFKDTTKYLPFADWWGFDNFREEDYQKEKMPNGKEIMALVEQAYIAYVKQLLEKQPFHGILIHNHKNAREFLPKLDIIIENYPQLQYPPYLKAKLLLFLGEKDSVLSVLLPFAKRKKNDFWAWEVLSEAFQDDEEKVLACYCRALTCNSPEEMLVNLRLKMAELLIKRDCLNEAKTEIEKSVATRIAKGWPITNKIKNWQNSEWYQKATDRKSNDDFYQKYVPVADELLFSDVPEESILVTFVNTDRKILNFIASEDKFGFFKYERFIDKVSVGDTLNVRFKSGSKDDIYQVHTVSKSHDDNLRQKFIKEIEGEVKLPEGKGFGFVNGIFIQPSLVSKNKLADGMPVKGQAIKSFDSKKNQWGWKIVSFN